jgi:hypothetical protein
MEKIDLSDYEQARLERDLAAIELERLAYDIRDAQIAYHSCKNSVPENTPAENLRGEIDHKQQQLARNIVAMVEERMQYVEMHAEAERSMRHKLEYAVSELHGQLAYCSDRMRQARSPHQHQAIMLQCDHTRAQLSQAEQRLFALNDRRDTKRMV